MPDLSEKLGLALVELSEIQNRGRHVYRSNELKRVHRERLLKNGFLRQIIKGWLLATSPEVDSGDSTPWFVSFWEFCATYCDNRFGTAWHLSAEQSLLLHAENTSIPKQVIIHAPTGTNNKVELLFDTSIYDLKHEDMPQDSLITVRDGLRLMNPEVALTKVPEAFFIRNQVEAQVVLHGVQDTSDVLSHLLNGGHSAVAGRLAGAFRRISRPDVAEEITHTMKMAGYDVREKDPFQPHRQLLNVPSQPIIPIVGRIEALWKNFRSTVVNCFPDTPQLPMDHAAYLQHVDDVYQSDAYHSLSIEGYRVTPELIERVSSGKWDPDKYVADQRNQDALVARGYWQAFRAVRQTVAAVIAGENAAQLVVAAQRDWYQSLFQPCVAAGLLPASALAGYRNHAVHLRGSRHVPPRWETIRHAMPIFFDLLKEEPHPAVRALVGHWLFGYIHPYADGNGRIARFIMNVMLASGGYPWTVIRVDDRKEYLTALERASVDQDIEPFADFISTQVVSSTERALLDQSLGSDDGS